MFEGFNAHLWAPNSGRLMWMSHPAWPSMEWQMYSSDYSTHGAFFGVKKACEPVHAQLDEPDADIRVVNNTTRPLFNLLLITRVVDVTGDGISTREDTRLGPVELGRTDLSSGHAGAGEERRRLRQAHTRRRTGPSAL